MSIRIHYRYLQYSFCVISGHLKYLTDTLSIWLSSMLVHSTCVLRDFYVDDMLIRADIVDKLKQIHDENIQLLKLGDSN